VTYCGFVRLVFFHQEISIEFLTRPSLITQFVASRTTFTAHRRYVKLLIIAIFIDDLSLYEYTIRHRRGLLELRYFFTSSFRNTSSSIPWQVRPTRESTLASRKPSPDRNDRHDDLQGPADGTLNFDILSTCATLSVDYRWCWRRCSLGNIGDIAEETVPHPSRAVSADWICIELNSALMTLR